jgi:molybdate transport system substrate-binding protein
VTRRIRRPLAFLVTAISLLAAPAAASAISVYAATSLTNAFPKIDSRPAFNFAGSDALAAQIEAGAPADVYAAASPTFPKKLYKEGRCTKPVTFATNVLVLITPPSNPAHIHSVYDLARGSKKKLAIGDPSVPIGAYTRKLLKYMHLGNVLTRNTVSNEPNVGAIVSAVALGSADAGFVYVTDWKANRSHLRKISIPRSVQPRVRYEMCRVIRPGASIAGANRFIRKVVGPTGRRVLHSFGFGLPRIH